MDDECDAGAAAHNDKRNNFASSAAMAGIGARLAGLGQSFWVEILSATAFRSAVISASIQDW